jgi:riboflavin synthase
VDQILQNKLEVPLVKVNYKIFIESNGLISSSVYTDNIIIGVFYHEKMSGGAEAEADRSSILENQKQNF